jgi:hypothetical protein
MEGGERYIGYVRVGSLKVTEGWPRCFWCKPRVSGANRPVEAIARDGQVDQTNRVRR